MVHFAAVRNVEQTSSDSTKTVYTIKAGMKSLNYGYSISGNITVYLYINGTQVKSWTGGFSSAYGETKTKYFGTYTYTVNKTHASQSVSIYTKVKNSSGFDNGTDSSTTWSGTVAAKPSYSVSYNANGGSGVPAGQTKWYNETLVLQAKGSLARTGYTPQGWATSAGGAAAYSFGASYTGNAALTLYAAWKPNTYTVDYVTGGSAVDSTSRTFNANYTLSSTKPTKDGYNFIGWATTDGGAAAYAAGQSIDYNKSTAANLTLYAAWELAYARPTVSLKVARDEDGSTATATASWVVNEDGNTFQRAVLEWKPRASEEYTVVEEVTTPGATGATFEIHGAVTTESYDVRLTVYDETGSGTASDILTQSYYTMDFLAGGRGVAIGAPATEEGFKCAMDAEFTGDIALGGDLSVTKGGVTIPAVKAVEGDNYGHGLLIGAGGLTLIGSGESAQSIWDAGLFSAGGEAMAVASDNMIYFLTNCNTIGNRAQATMSNNQFIFDGNNGVFANPYAVFSCSAERTLSTSDAKITCGTQVYRVGTGIFSANAGGIKVSKAGNYLVTVQIATNSGYNSGDQLNLRIYRDGTSMQRLFFRGSGNTGCCMTRMCWADAGATFYLYASNGTSARGVIAANGNTFIQVVAV